MDDVIQCPTCSKKYRLKGAPPPTFQCRSCGTVMDLSAFAASQPAQPAAPPPPPAAGPASAPGGIPVRHHGRPGRGHRRGGRGHGGDGGKSRRDQVPEDEYGYEDERPHYRSKQGASTGLILGSIGGVLVAIVLIFVMVGRDKDKEIEETPEIVATLPPPPPPPPPEPEPVKSAPKVTPGREDEKRPELREGRLENVPIPEGKRKYHVGQAEIKTYPWPDHVTAEEKNRIEKEIDNLKWGGRDSRDAENYFAELDAFPKPGEEFKVVGRLINEFKTICDEFNNDLTQIACMSRLMVIDRILRRIDGMQQRDFGDRAGIRSQSTDKHAMTVMKRWNWWYDLEKWRMRREPWDERDDLMDPEEMGEDDWE